MEAIPVCGQVSYSREHPSRKPTSTPSSTAPYKASNCRFATMMRRDSWQGEQMAGRRGWKLSGLDVARKHDDDAQEEDECVKEWVVDGASHGGK